MTSFNNVSFIVIGKTVFSANGNYALRLPTFKLIIVPIRLRQADSSR